MDQIVIGAGTGDVQASTGATQLHGYSVQATIAPATVVIRDGTTDTGPPVAFVELATVDTETGQLPAVDITTGVFVDRQAGTTRLVLYIT